MSDRPVAIVTGAGGGIGRAICRELNDAGYCLALVGRTRRSLAETAAMFDSDDVELILADLGIAADARGAVNQANDAWGRLDVLVNNAAVAPMGPVERSDQGTLERTFAVNVFGPFHMVSRIWSTFVRQRNGCVVNISSMATIDPFPGLAIYAATKAALESLTRSIVNEGGEQGMTAYSIAPGAVETNMLRSVVDKSTLPNEFTLAPEDIARIVLECVQGKRKDDNGKVIEVPSPEMV